jgi:uncharacterized membrane protein YbhN (UPF0104 family)
MKKAKPALILLMKLVISAGLLGYFFTRLHIEHFVNTFASADFSYIALTLVVYLVSQFVSAIRWTVLVRPLGFKTPFKILLQYYLIGMFFNLFAPGTVGGDVSRVYYLARDGEKISQERRGGSTMHAAVSVLMDRALGMAVLVWLGAIGLVIFPGYAVPSLVRSLTFALAIGFVVGGLLVPVLRRVLPQDGHPLVVKLRVALRSYWAHWRTIPAAVVISLGVHLIQAWIHLILGRAIHIEIPFSYCIIVYPLVGTFSALPVSLNGLGLREGGYLLLLQVIGVNSEKAVAFGLLLFLTAAIDSLIGGLVFILKKSPKPMEIAVTGEELKKVAPE